MFPPSILHPDQIVRPSQLLNDTFFTDQGISLIETRWVPFSSEFLPGNIDSDPRVIKENNPHYSEKNQLKFCEIESNTITSRQYEIRTQAGLDELYLLEPDPEGGCYPNLIDKGYKIDNNNRPIADSAISMRRGVGLLSRCHDNATICAVFIRGERVIAIAQYHVDWLSAIAGIGDTILETTGLIHEKADDMFVYVPPFAQEGVLVHGESLLRLEKSENTQHYLRYQCINRIHLAAFELSDFIEDLLFDALGLPNNHVEISDQNTISAPDLYSRYGATHFGQPHGSFGAMLGWAK